MLSPSGPHSHANCSRGAIVGWRFFGFVSADDVPFAGNGDSGWKIRGSTGNRPLLVYYSQPAALSIFSDFHKS
jgi:hypothetical protein